MSAANRTLLILIAASLASPVALAVRGAGETLGDGPSLVPSTPSGHVTLHRWPGVNPGPTILVLPPQVGPNAFTCTKWTGPASATSSPANVGDMLTHAGNRVSCQPPAGPAGSVCRTINVYGYAASAGSGATVTITGSCTGLSASASFPSPGGADTDTAMGAGTFPFDCSPSWTGVGPTDDWWVHCQVN